MENIINIHFNYFLLSIFIFHIFFSDILQGFNFAEGKFCGISRESYFVENSKIHENRKI